jgi:hypothetical protein
MEAVVSQRATPLTRVVRYLALCAVVLVIGAAALIGGCEYLNSQNAAVPTDSELRLRFSRAADWVLKNREQALNEDNAMLWLFIREAGKRTGDQRLLALAAEFQARHPDTWMWRYIFDANGRERVAGLYFVFPDYFPDYNRLFIYGATCNASAREDPAVIALLSPSACGSTFTGLRLPWCRTHQLMGLRFIQQNHCEPDETTDQTVAQLQDFILRELRWDFRVADAYIQKVLMLVESGRREDVRAIWLRRILEEQRADGGWDGVYIVAHLPGNRVFSWEGRLYPVIAPQRPSNLHATAQALYLLALWLEKTEAPAPPG